MSSHAWSRPAKPWAAMHSLGQRNHDQPCMISASDTMISHAWSRPAAPWTAMHGLRQRHHEQPSHEWSRPATPWAAMHGLASDIMSSHAWSRPATPRVADTSSSAAVLPRSGFTTCGRMVLQAESSGSSGWRQGRKVRYRLHPHRTPATNTRSVTNATNREYQG